MTCKTDQGDHSTHAKGLVAFLGIKSSPLNLLGTAWCGHVLGPNKNLSVKFIFFKSTFQYIHRWLNLYVLIN